MQPKYYPIAQRLLHWLIAACILFMLLTVFLRLNWMSKQAVSSSISESLQKEHIELSKQVVRNISGKIKRPMWQWHIYIGYVLIGLFTLRMLLFALVKGTLTHEGTNSQKDKMRVWIYRIFYVLLGGILLTGFLIENGSRSIRHTMEELHEWALYIAITFIILHFVGLILGELGTHKGIVSKMINGGEKLNK